MRQSRYEKAEHDTYSLKSLKLISGSLFYYTLAGFHFLVSSCYLQQRELTFNLRHPATLTYADMMRMGESTWGKKREGEGEAGCEERDQKSVKYTNT